ncbi:MAG: prolipoprotein diacylglyceryl transferase [Oscillospiraceae bacterium]|nr:prolipoprotein diacylglyceryl transferase [Oscillospiraceae bacterium]MDD4367497.1 prolipoprotein diacylglyceryl transferase [Oscillospiraceae bacterium]
MSDPDYIVSFPGLGIDNLNINREVFSIGSVAVYWYGLLIAVAFLIGILWALHDSKKYSLKQDDILDIFLLAIPLGIVGARAYYVIFNFSYFKDDLWQIFNTRRGGLAFYGGVIGGVLGVLIMTRIKKLSFAKMLDFFVPYLALGQGIGRWGNFFNQEAFGTNTSLPWGMYSNGTRDYLSAVNLTGVDPNQPVHPTFLYEFLANTVIFIILMNVRKRSRLKLETFAWYLVLYGLVRFFVESIRTDSLYIDGTGIRVSMLLSAVMVLAGAVYLIVIHVLSRHHQRRQEMAVLMGQAADGGKLKATAADELDEEDERTFQEHVAAHQGTAARDTNTKPYRQEDLEQALNQSEADPAEAAAADRSPEAFQPAVAAESQDPGLDKLREEARLAAEAALHRQAAADAAVAEGQTEARTETADREPAAADKPSDPQA